MFGFIKKALNRIKQKGGIIGTTWDDLWFFKSSFRFKRDFLTIPRYTASVWAYRSINKIAENIASVPLKIYRDNPKGKKEEIKDGRWLRLLDRPNPDYSFREMIKRTVMLMDTEGEAFWYLERDNIAQIPRSIRLLHPRHMRPVTNENNEVLYWIYREKEKLDFYELVHFKYYNPYNEIRGLSPLDAIILSVEQDFLATLFNRNFFEQGAVLSGFIKAPDTLTDVQYRRLREQFEERHTGVSKAHRIAILEGGMDFKESQITQRDMQFVDMKKITREEIFTAFGTNPVVLGLYEDVKSYEGIKTAHKAFWQETIIPRLRLIEDTLYHYIFANIGNGEIYPEFDLANVEALQEDFAKKVETAKILWEMGYPINEINRRLELGMAEVPWGDSWWDRPDKVPMGTLEEKAYVTVRAKEMKTKQADPLLEELERTHYWEEFTKNVIEPLEEELQKKIKRFFYEQRKKVLQTLKELSSSKAIIRKDYAEILLDWDKELKDLREVLEKFYDKALEEGITFTLQEYGGIGIAYEPLKIEALGEFNLRIKTIPEQILRTIKKDLKVQITEGLIKGETINQIQDRIRKVYNMASSRALTIARTETVSAVMSGRLKAFKGMGVKKVMWVTAKDERVRDSHVRINGTIQVLGKRFPNGCRYPGDPTAPAGEVINCRCVIIPVKRDFIFTGGEPKTEVEPSFGGWLSRATPQAKEFINEIMDFLKNLSFMDPRLMSIYARITPKKIKMKSMKRYGGYYDPETQVIILNSNLRFLDEEIRAKVLIHELTHTAQYQKGLQYIGSTTPSHLMTGPRFRKTLRDILKQFEFSDVEIQRIEESFFSFVRPVDYRDLKYMSKAMFGDKWRKVWTASLKVDWNDELKFRFLYHLSNPAEFQAVIMELRARRLIREGSALWKITEAILDDIERRSL